MLWEQTMRFGIDKQKSSTQRKETLAAQTIWQRTQESVNKVPGEVQTWMNTSATHVFQCQRFLFNFQCQDSLSTLIHSTTMLKSC